MTFYKYSALVVALVSAALSVIIAVGYGTKRLRNITLGLFSLCVSLWAGITLCMTSWNGYYLTLNSDQAIMFCRLRMAAILFIPTLSFHFICNAIEYKKARNWIHGGYVASLLLFLANLFSDLIVRSTHPVLDILYWTVPGPLFHVHVAMFLGYLIKSVFVLYDSYRHAGGIRRTQYKLALGALMLTFSGGATNYPLCYGITIVPFGTILIIFIVPLIVLMDPSFVTRSVLMHFTCFTLGLVSLPLIYYSVYLLANYAFRDQIHLHIAVFSTISILLGLLIRPFYRIVQRSIDKLLYPEYHERYRKLTHMSHAVLSQENFSKLARTLFDHFISSIKVTKLSFYLWSEGEQAYCLQHSSSLRDDPECGQDLKKLYENHCIPRYLAGSDYLAVGELTKSLVSMKDDRSSRVESTNASLDDKLSIETCLKNVRAELVVPIRKNRLLGFLVIGSKESGLPYTAEEIKDIRGLADLTAIVTNSAFLAKSHSELSGIVKVLEDTSTRDPLTNLYNRKKIKECLGHVLARAKERREPVSVILADIDHFKKINDTYGHPAGDEVINKFAEILVDRAGNSENSDKLNAIGRLGGEEFLVVLANTDLEGARLVAETILRETRLAIAVYNGGPGIRFTVSLGIAGFPRDGSNPVQLIAKADELMYAAKQSGRDRAILQNPHCAVDSEIGIAGFSCDGSDPVQLIAKANEMMHVAKQIGHDRVVSVESVKVRFQNLDP